MRLNRLLLIVPMAVALAVSGPLHGQSASSSDAQALEVLERAGARYAAVKGLCADFEQVIEVTLLGETKHSRGRMCQQQPNLFLMDFTEPAGDLVVADGESLWIYYPSTDDKQVFRQALGSGGGGLDFHREFLADPGVKYVATYQAREVAGGQVLHVIGIVPNAPASYERARVWIDEASGLIHRVILEEENGSIRNVALSNLDVNPVLDPALFSFTPPPGANVLER